MNKNIAFYLMIGGALVSGYDLFSGGKVYGAGAPLEKLRYKVYTDSASKNYYISVSDVVALTGAFFYFK